MEGINSQKPLFTMFVTLLHKNAADKGPSAMPGPEGYV